MTTPTVVKRNLTFDFSRSVEFQGQTPATMEVAIVALFDPSSPVVDQTFVSPEPVVQTVLLAEEHNLVTFQLVPSSASYLTTQINYRVMWRAGVTGRTNDVVIAMPDQDVTFDQLSSLGAILGGSSFLQVTDLSKPGRVAQLNTAGQVVDAFGVPVADAGDITVVEGLINAETNARQVALNALSTTLNETIQQQVEAAETTAQANLATAVENVNLTIGQAEAAAASEVANESQRAQAAEAQIGVNTAAIDAINTDLTKKADLDANGWVPMDQINPAATSTATQVNDEQEMLALTPTQVQPGDLAIRPDGIYLLIAPDPSQMNSWLDLSRVSSVNGQQGDVVLTPADIGALATNGNITIGQVIGLAAILATLTPATTTAQIATQVQAILGDTTYAHTSGGLLPKALMPGDSVYIDSSNELLRKDGTVISGVGGGSGGTGNVVSVNGKEGIVVLNAGDVGAIPTGGQINESQVNGLQTSLDAKVSTTDSRLSDARTPLQHAATHGASGSDPVTLTTAQIVNLNTALATINNNVSSLQTQVTTIETGGGDVSSVLDGGNPSDPGAGSLPEAGVIVFWEPPALETASTPGGLMANVTLHSPFGRDTTGAVTGTQGTYYANPAGAAAGDILFPSLSPNGHLILTKWDETAPADVPPASSTDLSSLQAVVATKANEADLLTGLASKANQSDLTTTNGNVSALQAQLTSYTTTPITLSNLPTNIPESYIANLSTDLASKASATSLATAVGNITTLQGQMPHKADLDSNGLVPLNQMSQVIPETYVQNLVSDLANRVTQAQLTTTNGNVSAIQNALPLKADLDPTTHKLLSSQIPSIALETINVVVNRAAMLALSPNVVHVGSICVINQTADLGTYILSASDPSQFSNWVELPTPTGSVSSVNGYSGTVVLAASDVGALAAGVPIAQSQITGLTNTLASLATNAALTQAVSGLQSASQVQSTLQSSVPIKALASYVATTSVASLSGQQSIDGVVVASGTTVLLTAQASSVNNGLWVVSNGPWSRTSDFATGSYFVRDTIVMVSSGNTRANTFWQQTNTAGVVDTNANNWSLVMQAGPPIQYTAAAGGGLSLNNLAFSVSAGTGITTAGGQVAVDTAVVPRKFSVTLPGGTTVQTVTHNLNTTDIAAVYVKDTSTNTMVLAGAPVIINANSLSIEFKNAPNAGQYRVTVLA